MNARHTRGLLAPNECGDRTFSVSFYEMVIVVEKTPYLNREMLILFASDVAHSPSSATVQQDHG